MKYSYGWKQFLYVIFITNAYKIQLVACDEEDSTDTSTLPRLGSGKFDVGWVETMISDGENDDGILLTIYYPADSTPTDEKSQNPLWLTRKEYVDGVAAYQNLSSLLFHVMNEWIIGEKRIPARRHVALNSTAGNFPILIFSHGLAACRNFYSVYCSSLASHGYIVAVIEHGDGSACWTYKLKIDKMTGKKIEIPIKIRKRLPTDNRFQLRNRQLHKRVAECVKTAHLLKELNLGQFTSDRQAKRKLLLGNDFLWSQFKGRLDTSRIFIAGHSFGGATAIAAAAAAPTIFTAVVVIDGWMFPIDKEMLTRVRQPVLFINAENFQWEANTKDMLRIIKNSERSVLLTLNGAMHHTFTDFPLLLPKLFSDWFGVDGDYDPVEYFEAFIGLTKDFLKSYYEDPHASLNLSTYGNIVTMGVKYSLRIGKIGEEILS